jgi:hypothetical protein
LLPLHLCTQPIGEMRVVTFILISLIVNVGHAQFDDSTHYFTGFSSTGVINKTNEGASYVLSSGLRFNVRKKSVTVNSTNSYIYGLQRERLTNNDFTSTLDFNLYKTLPHFYYWGLANFDKSFSLKINQRVQVGLGVAYNVLDRQNAFINISDGIIYESSDLKLNDTSSTVYKTYRNSFRFRHRFVINEIIVLEGTNFLQNSLTYKNDYIIKAVNSVSVKLRKWLSFTTSTTYNRIQRTNRENLLVTFGLTAEKYF